MENDLKKNRREISVKSAWDKALRAKGCRRSGALRPALFYLRFMKKTNS
jgi:hypothetical protein